MNHNGLTPVAAAQFHEGINLVLSQWSALRMAVENGWGGPHSLQISKQLADDLFNLLTRSKEKVYSDDVENMLDDCMDALSTVIEDGSIYEVADQVMVMYEECLEGNFDSIKSLRERKAPTLSYTRQPINDDEEDSEEDDGVKAMTGNNSSEMEVDAPQCQSSSSQKCSVSDENNTKEVPEVVDGWTVVSSRRSKGRKN